MHDIMKESFSTRSFDQCTERIDQAVSWSFSPHGMGTQSFLEEEKNALNTSMKHEERNDKDISMAIL